MTKIYKTTDIHIRVTKTLKDKFSVAIGPLNVSVVIENLIYDYIKDYEKNFGVIKMPFNKSDKIDFFKRHLGMNVTENDLESLRAKDVRRFGGGYYKDDNFKTDESID